MCVRARVHMCAYWYIVDWHIDDKINILRLHIRERYLSSLKRNISRIIISQFILYQSLYYICYICMFIYIIIFVIVL